MDSFKQIQCYHRLTSLGKAALLQGEMNEPEIEIVKNKAQSYKEHFKYYNKRKPGFNRYGLSLTSRDGGFSGVPDLDSLMEYNKEHGTDFKESSFKTWTPLFKELHYLQEIMEPFHKYISRSHILRLNKGGFFPPHRDDLSFVPQSFRIFMSLSHPDWFVFLLNNEVQNFFPGRLYFINTYLSHSLFSFRNENDFLIFNIDLSEESVKTVLRQLKIK